MVDRILDEVEQAVLPPFNAAIIPLQNQLRDELTEEGDKLYYSIEHLSIANMTALARASFQAGYALAITLHQSKMSGSGS